MELHKALKNIVATDGEKSLLEPRLVNILNDLQAFEAIPAGKYMLAALIRDGFVEKFISVGSWNSSTQSFAYKASLATGFEQEKIDIVFQSIAYSLGWIKEIKRSSNKKQNSPAPAPAKATSKEQLEEHLQGVVSHAVDWKNEYGIDFQSISFEIQGKKEVDVHAEILGQIKGYHKHQTLYIGAIIYDDKNKIRYNDQCAILLDSNLFRGFGVYSFNLELPMPVAQIGKILFMATYYND